jgi:hypothetical protein
MTDRKPDPHPDSPPEADTGDDERPDIEQAVEARSDAVKRGEGGDEPATFTAPGLYDGHSGTGAVVKNQDRDAQ